MVGVRNTDVVAPDSYSDRVNPRMYERIEREGSERRNRLLRDRRRDILYSRAIQHPQTTCDSIDTSYKRYSKRRRRYYEERRDDNATAGSNSAQALLDRRRNVDNNLVHFTIYVVIRERRLLLRGLQDTSCFFQPAALAQSLCARKHRSIDRIHIHVYKEGWRGYVHGAYGVDDYDAVSIYRE